MTEVTQNETTSAAATAEELYNVQVQGIKAAYDDTMPVTIKKATYNFRSQNVERGIDPETGEKIVEKYKRPSVTIPLFYPNAQSLMEILAGSGPMRELVFQAVEDVVYSAGYAICSNDSTVTSANFPLTQLDFEEIAKRMLAEGTSRGLDMDALKAFADDYKSCMAAICGRPQDHVDNAAGAFLKRFAGHRTSKDILSRLSDLLNMYIEKAPNAQNYVDVCAWLRAKLDELLSATQDELFAI